MTISSPTPIPQPNTGAGFRRAVIAAMAMLALTSLVVAGSAGAASAHDGPHASGDTETATLASGPSTWSSSDSLATSRSKLTARETAERFHLAAINDGFAEDLAIGSKVGVVDRGQRTGDLIQAPGQGQANPLDVDCFVDFDDDLVLEFYVPGGAENTFMTSHWYQKCFDSYHPAVAVKYLNYGHFHLGYEDPRIGPCSGNQSDWGRKADAPPADQDAFLDWVMADCVSEIDPMTEPRSGIYAHLPGHKGQIVAYDGDGYLPFTLRTFEVVSGEVEICHLTPGPVVVANGGGSPWQCTVWGEGYWDLSDHVPNAIEVRFEFLTNGQVDNIGVDLNA